MSDDAESNAEENGSGVIDKEDDSVEQDKVEEKTEEISWSDLVNHVYFCFIYI